MTPSLVSILIPCHNGSAYLRATLDSALGQTYPHCEVIVVDDGSTDDSLALARSYEPRIKVFSGPQKGASAARDRATQESRGEWLQYLDADDLLLPHAVASRVAALQAAPADVACGDWRRLLPGAGGTWIAGKLEVADGAAAKGQMDLVIFKGFWAPPAALLYRRELVERIGAWPPNLPVIQDARFLFNAGWQGGRFVHVPGESAQYRQHEAQSLSTRSRGRFWRDILTNSREVESLWSARGILDRDRREALAGAYDVGARVSFPIDRELYRANLTELRRFPEHQPSRYLRVASGLERVLGYTIARRLMQMVRPAPLP
jgi:glycosyltransferase involved in cell wall biosynthesis